MADRSITGQYNHTPGKDDTSSNGISCGINGFEVELSQENTVKLGLTESSNKVAVENMSNKVNVSEMSNGIPVRESSNKVNLADMSNKINMSEASNKVNSADIRLLKMDNGEMAGWSGYTNRKEYGIQSATSVDLDGLNKVASIGKTITCNGISEAVINDRTVGYAGIGLKVRPVALQRKSGVDGLASSSIGMPNFDKLTCSNQEVIIMPSIGIAYAETVSTSVYYQYAPVAILQNMTSPISLEANISSKHERLGEESIAGITIPLKAKDQDGHMFNSETSKHRFEQARFTIKRKDSSVTLHIEIMAYYTSGSHNVPTAIPDVTTALHGWEYSSNLRGEVTINDNLEHTIEIPYYEGQDLSFFVRIKGEIASSMSDWLFTGDSKLDDQLDLKWFDIDMHDYASSYLSLFKVETWSRGIAGYAAGSGWYISGLYISETTSTSSMNDYYIAEAGIVEDHSERMYFTGRSGLTHDLEFKKIKSVLTAGNAEAESLIAIIPVDCDTRFELNYAPYTSVVDYSSYAKMLDYGENVSFGLFSQAGKQKLGFKHYGKYIIPAGSPDVYQAIISDIRKLATSEHLIAIIVKVDDQDYYFTLTETNNYSGGIYSNEPVVHACTRLEHAATTADSTSVIMAEFKRIRPASIYMHDSVLYKPVIDVEKFGLLDKSAISIFNSSEYFTSAILGFKDDVEYAMYAFVIPTGATIACMVNSTSTAGLSISSVGFGKLAHICSMPIVVDSTGEYVQAPQRMKDLYPEIANRYKPASKALVVGKTNVVQSENSLYIANNFIMVKADNNRLIMRDGQYYTNGEMVLCVNNGSTHVYTATELGFNLFGIIADTIFDNPMVVGRNIFFVGQKGLYGYYDNKIVLVYALSALASDGIIDSALGGISAVFYVETAVQAIKIDNNGYVARFVTLDYDAGTIRFIKCSDSIANYIINNSLLAVGKTLIVNTSLDRTATSGTVGYTTIKEIDGIGLLNNCFIIGLIINTSGCTVNSNVKVYNGTTLINTITSDGKHKIMFDEVDIADFTLNIAINGTAKFNTDVYAIAVISKEAL